MKAWTTSRASIVPRRDDIRVVSVSAGIVGHLQAIGALRPGLSFERARDILWTLIAWEVYELLVIERGWSLDDWESWIAESVAVLLLRQSPAKRLHCRPSQRPDQSALCDRQRW